MLSIGIATDDAFHFIERVHSLTALQTHPLSKFQALISNMEQARITPQGATTATTKNSAPPASATPIPIFGASGAPGVPLRGNLNPFGAQNSRRRQVINVFRRRNKLRDLDTGVKVPADRIQVLLLLFPFEKSNF